MHSFLSENTLFVDNFLFILLTQKLQKFRSMRPALKQLEKKNTRPVLTETKQADERLKLILGNNIS